MERILDIELAPKEKERADQLRKQHKTHGYLYMLESVSAAGEPCIQIIWSPTHVEDCDPTDPVEIYNITDNPE